MVRATVFPIMDDGRRAAAISEVERCTAADALHFLATHASATIELVMQQDPGVATLCVELAEIETTEQNAVGILTNAGIEAYLEHTGGGVWVAEARSETIAGRTVWVTDSEGDETGSFLVGAYADDPYAEEAIESLSGACAEGELVQRVSRGLSTEIEAR
jgi:hypothetical protein